MISVKESQFWRIIFAVVVILPFSVKSLNNTHDQQEFGSLDSCDQTRGQRVRSHIDIFPGNLTFSSFDLDQFNYDLRAVYTVGKDSWYDYIVIGAGTAGSVVASRLSEDPAVRVLLIEAGGKEDWINNIPGLRFSLQKSWRDYDYISVPQKKCCRQLVNNQLPVPRAKLIGGCSSINGAGYQRGPPEDFDRWDRIHGAKGWSFRDVFPYFVKSERVEPSKRLDLGYHGTRGPLPVRLRDPSKFGDAILGAFTELGYPVGDYNGRDAVRTSPAQNTFRQGLRYSTGRAYLSQASTRPSLDILIFARANRILFDDSSKKAIGVEYTARSERNRVFARKEIIISAGTIETPKLLMLSGLGSANHLKFLGIPVLVDLPGVGENLQNQPVVDLLFETEDESSNILQSINEFVIHRKGILAQTDASMLFNFFRTKLAKDERPDLELEIREGLYEGLGSIDQSGNPIGKQVRRSYYMPYEGESGFKVNPLVTHPYSRGWIKLASKDPDQAPLIDFNFLDDERDIDVLVEGCKLVQRMTQTKSMRPLKPRFLGVVEPCKDLPLFSDEYLRCMIPIMTSMWHHPVGTAKMGPPSDRYSVIDSELRVYGVKGLRIADASVMPETVSGHPIAAIIMIGERCADFIKGRQLRPSLPPIKDEKHLLTYD